MGLSRNMPTQPLWRRFFSRPIRYRRLIPASLPLAAMIMASLPFALATPALADEVADYPEKPIELIVQSSAGSSSDVFARQLAKAAEPILGQPIPIVLKPGGGGASQMSYIAAARPDGYTIGVNTLTHFTNLVGNLASLFSVDDFTWLAVVQEEPHLFAVRADAPWNTFTELDKAMAASGEALTVGGYGPSGSAVNIATKLAMQSADIDYRWVGFNASTEAITALLGGHLDMVALTPSNVLEFVEAGRVKVLGVTTAERTEVLPDVPTLAEQGYDTETDWQQIRGIYGPADMPEAIQKRLTDALLQAADTEAFRRYMTNSGIGYRLMGPEEYQQYAQRLIGIAERGIREGRQ